MTERCSDGQGGPLFVELGAEGGGKRRSPREWRLFTLPSKFAAALTIHDNRWPFATIAAESLVLTGQAACVTVGGFKNAVGVVVLSVAAKCCSTVNYGSVTTTSDRNTRNPHGIIRQLPACTSGHHVTSADLS